MQNNHLPTKSHVELQDNFIVVIKKNNVITRIRAIFLHCKDPRNEIYRLGFEHLHLLCMCLQSCQGAGTMKFLNLEFFD